MKAVERERSMKRHRFKQETSLETRLLMDAQSRRQRARQLPPGKERETLLEKAREDEVLVEWLTSSGLRQPR